MSLNEKRIKPGAAKPITGIKRQPARNQIGKQADQALSTAREPISMPEGYHVLNVILVTDSGKVSKATTREYYLQY